MLLLECMGFCCCIWALTDTEIIHVLCDCVNQPSDVVCLSELLFTSATFVNDGVWWILFRLWLSGTSLIAAEVMFVYVSHADQATRTGPLFMETNGPSMSQTDNIQSAGM